MVGDGTSGVLFAYADTRADAPGLYAQHVLGSGLLGGELPVAVVSSLVDAGIEAGCARLRWSLQGAPGTVATLYRRTDRSDWRTLGRVDADGQGFVSCTDCDVSEETRYGYRLGIPASAGETFSQEAWVTTPASPAGLRLSVRNPVVGGSIEASFALPDPGPVAVELFDLSGRRVASTTARAIAGVQHVDLAPASSLEPGVYVLRVCLARPVCARIAVVR
jgi:hypothetical protein